MKQFRTVDDDNGIRHRVENPDAEDVAEQIDLGRFAVGQQTRDEFESQFSLNAGYATVDLWKEAGFDSILCRCSEVYCSGWQMVKRYGNPGVAR